MDIGTIFYPKHRTDWRDWLKKNHETKTEIWLKLYKKDAGKASLPYDDLVEECLCFAWIDGVVKKLDEESRVQRITPRRKRNSFLSELNRQRVWKLQKQGLMTKAGLEPIKDQLGSETEPLAIPDWISQQLQADETIWQTFQTFPYYYKRLKVGWITEPKGNRQDERQKRLNHLIKMTSKGKRYGTEPLKGITYEIDG